MKTTFTFYGHSTLGLAVGDFQLVVDPYFTGNSATSMTPDQVHPDYILITHGHSDHLGDAVAIAKRRGATCIATSELCRWLSGKGVKTHAMHIGGGFHFPFGYLKLTPALHASMLPDGSNGGSPSGFLLTTSGGKKIYMAGDTGLFGDMRLIGEEGLDLAAIPIGDNFTMGPDDALRAVKLLTPKVVIPIHFNTYASIQQDGQAWKTRVEQETQTKVMLLRPGESYVIEA